MILRIASIYAKYIPIFDVPKMKLIKPFSRLVQFFQNKIVFRIRLFILFNENDPAGY